MDRATKSYGQIKEIQGEPSEKTSFCLWDLKGRGIRKQVRNIVLDCIPSE